MSEILKDILLSMHSIELGCVRVGKVFNNNLSEKEDKSMTDTQVRYATQVENIRHDKAVEAENLRHDLQTEYQAAMDLAEKKRANLASEANSRYAADQSRAGNEAKAAASELGAKLKQKQDWASMVTSNWNKAAERDLDRELQDKSLEFQGIVESRKADISQEANDIKRDANNITAAKNENDFQIAKDKLKQGAEDLARKLKEYGLDLERFDLDKKKFTHTKLMDTWKETNNSIKTATGAAKDLITSIDMVKYGDVKAAGNLINAIANLARSAGGNDNE